jgi:hypothetical protein
MLIASSVEAKANSYLFRLTDDEINEVMSRYYPRGYDREAVLSQMSEPFDCKNFGDLCGEVGSEYAYRMVESAWTRARMGFPEMIYRAAERKQKTSARQWFEQTYPLGVDDRDPLGRSEIRLLLFKRHRDQRGSPDQKLQHPAQPRLVVWGRVLVEHFKKNTFGNWKKSKADHLEVEGMVVLSVGEIYPEPGIGFRHDVRWWALVSFTAAPFRQNHLRGRLGGVGPNSPSRRRPPLGSLPSSPHLTCHSITPNRLTNTRAGSITRARTQPLHLDQFGKDSGPEPRLRCPATGVQRQIDQSLASIARTAGLAQDRGDYSIPDHLRQSVCAK